MSERMLPPGTQLLLLTQHPANNWLKSPDCAELSFMIILLWLQTEAQHGSSNSRKPIVGATALPDDIGRVEVLGAAVPVAVPLPQGSG